MTFKIHGLEMGGKVTSWQGIWMWNEYMKDTVSECVNVRVCEWMWKGLWVGGCQMDIRSESRVEAGMCNKNNIIRAMHSLWFCNIICIGKSVMDKFVVRTPRVFTGTTGEVSQCIDSVPQKRSQYVIDILLYFWNCL